MVKVLKQNTDRLKDHWRSAGDLFIDCFSQKPVSQGVQMLTVGFTGIGNRGSIKKISVIPGGNFFIFRGKVLRDKFGTFIKFRVKSRIADTGSKEDR